MKTEITETIENFLDSQIKKLEVFGESEQLSGLKMQQENFKRLDQIIDEGLKKNLSLEHIERLELKHLRFMLIKLGYPKDDQIIKKLDFAIEEYTAKLGYS